MSWSETFSNLTYNELDDLEPKNEQTDKNQFQAALSALIEIADSGSLGDPAKIKFSGSLSGHVNENHVPLPGWSPDSISLYMTQVREPSALDKAANG